LSVYPVSTSLQVQKTLQYVKEVTRGTTPTSPTFVNAGPIQDWTPSMTTNSIDYRMLGSEDIYKVIKTGERFSFDIAYNPIDKGLLEFGINLAGTNDRYDSLTMLISQLMNVSGTLTEKYMLMKGCQCDSTTIDVTLEAVGVTQTWIPSDITTPAATAGIGTPVFAPAITATPWTGINGGLNSLTFNGSNTTKLRNFSVTIDNNIDQVQPVGSSLVLWAQPTTRDITGTFDVIYENDNFLADAKTVQARTMSYILDTVAPTTLTFTDVYLKEYNETISATSTEVKTQSYAWRAKSVTI
jgi:Phage tail tube protein